VPRVRSAVTAVDAGHGVSPSLRDGSAGRSTSKATVGDVINKPIATWSTPGDAIGSPEDEPATDIAAPQTLISLLKAILVRDWAEMKSWPQRLDALEQRLAALERRARAQ
jgi:hypothetical protein